MLNPSPSHSPLDHRVAVATPQITHCNLHAIPYMGKYSHQGRYLHASIPGSHHTNRQSFRENHEISNRGFSIYPLASKPSSAKLYMPNATTIVAWLIPGWALMRASLYAPGKRISGDGVQNGATSWPLEPLPQAIHST